MKKTIKDFDLANKKVIIRVDFNVPIKNGIITDDNRIVESLNTINYALSNNAKIILLSHLGRVKTEEDKEKNSLLPVAKRLSELLNRKVRFIDNTDFNIIKENVNNMNNGDIILLQNTRYYDLDNKMESSNSIELASNYASLADIYINDAFGTLHRAHASNVGISSILPNGIGLLVEKELTELEILNNPEKEYSVILGGAKVSDKIKVIEELAKKCDHLIIGGAMANTFLKAKGISIGKSFCEDECLDFCNEMLTKYNSKIILPIDFFVSKDYNEEFASKTINDIDNDDIILDIGNNSIELIKESLKNTKTVFWNGPLGYYELDSYMKGTKTILEFLIDSDIKTILGGGDIVACSKNLGLKDKVYYASTGGGATLEYLEGKELPGLKAIQDKE